MPRKAAEWHLKSRKAPWHRNSGNFHVVAHRAYALKTFVDRPCGCFKLTKCILLDRMQHVPKRTLVPPTFAVFPPAILAASSQTKQRLFAFPSPLLYLSYNSLQVNNILNGNCSRVKICWVAGNHYLFVKIREDNFICTHNLISPCWCFLEHHNYYCFWVIIEADKTWFYNITA